MDDPIDSAFYSRRFAHGKSKSKSGRSGGVTKPFNPLATLGRYEVTLGAGSSASQHALEIHELTEGETGLVGTFDFAKLTGMFALAGSRKGLAEIVAGLEEEGSEHDDDGTEDGGGEEGHESDSDAKDGEYERSALELQDEALNRRARAFEKNSFRNPKFWMRWKGTKLAAHVADGADQDIERKGLKQVDSDMGYLVFANNACDRFEGTITCPSLDWKQLKMKGRKIHSNARSCPMSWSS